MVACPVSCWRGAAAQRRGSYVAAGLAVGVAEAVPCVCVKDGTAQHMGSDENEDEEG